MVFGLFVVGLLLSLGSDSISCLSVFGLASVASVCLMGVGLGATNGVLALGLAVVSFPYSLAIVGLENPSLQDSVLEPRLQVLHLSHSPLILLSPKRPVAGPHYHQLELHPYS